MVASLALSTRFRRRYVWLGAAAAFLLHVGIALTAGHFIALLPHRPLEAAVGALFLLGAGLVAFGKGGIGWEKERTEAAHGTDDRFLKAFATSFTVIFVGEWGDITQIAIANYAAKYHAPLSVGIGAVTALWSAAAVAVLLGAKLLSHVPARTLQRVIAGVLLLFAIFSISAAVR